VEEKMNSFRDKKLALKRLAKSALLGVYKYSGAMAAQEQVSYWTGKSAVPILLFHRVTDEIPPDGLTVSTAWFRGLCQILHRRFNVVSLTEAMNIVESGKRPARRTVAITFDDCYRDNLDAACVLADHGLPACFFIPTAYVGTDHVFEWDRDLPRMRNLTWDEVKEMARLGHEIGSHTVTHPDMGEVGDEQARLPLVWDAGYEACFSAHGGFIYPGMNRQVLPREPVPCFRDLLNFELHLSGCLCWTYALRRKVGLL
jgi:hypothetical protein